MLPWEHVAVAYLGFSLAVRLLRGRPPTGPEAVAVAFAALLPDLVDKPLAWELHLLNGKSLGHSLLFAIPVTALAWWRAGRRVGLAVAFALVTHGLGDVAYRLALGLSLDWTFLIWPLVERPAAETPGLLANTSRWIAYWGEFVASPGGRRYLLLEVAMLGGALLLWLRDGRPGPRAVGALFRRDADPLESP